MNKSQLIEELASRFDGNKKDAQHALESVLDTITRAVASGEKVSITGFGAFERLDRPARMVRNPRTGERKRAKKTSIPKFRAGADLKAVVSGQKKLPKLKAATTKSATAGKTAAKSTKAAPAKKTTAKTASKTATKAPAKKSTAKTTATKAPAKKSTAKTTARKATTKKAPATKTTAKKTAKRTTKKTTAKR